MDCMCLEETLSSGIFKKQISTLLININKNREMLSTENVVGNICNGIFTVFTNLRHLQFNELSYKKRFILSFDFPPTFFSSTLLQLNVRVYRFDECLYLLDGRFNQLHTFHVNILTISPLLLEINQQVGKITNVLFLFYHILFCYSR